MHPGCINFIGASASNNGLTGKISNNTHLHPAGTITVTYNGSVGECFYQTERFWASDDVNVLYPKFEMNEQIALFFLAPLSKKGKGYGYAFKWTKEKMENDSIELPIKSNGEIDFDFIESRIRELEESRIRELEAYLLAAGFEDCTLTKTENESLQKLNEHKIILKAFKIGDLFNDFTGRDIIIRDTKEGNIPLISHQHDDNGISKYIAPIEGRRIFSYKNTLSLADRGVFLATTQDHDFHIGTRVKALTFKDGEKSESIRLFFVAAINKLQIMFSEYLTNATDSLPSLNIVLPVKADGTIDFAFMNTYISAIKKQCIATLKQKISREHKAYENAVGVNSVEIDADEKEAKVVILPEYREGSIPIYTLRAACGAFEDEEKPETDEWVDVTGHGFTPDKDRYFVVQAKGESMLPKIKDGDLCVFEWSQYHAGSRNGEIVLARTYEFDPEFDGRYTIKKYSSEKVETEDSWQHVKIELHPLNHDPKYKTIEINEDMKRPIIGILKCVL